MWTRRSAAGASRSRSRPGCQRERADDAEPLEEELTLLLEWLGERVLQKFSHRSERERDLVICFPFASGRQALIERRGRLAPTVQRSERIGTDPEEGRTLVTEPVPRRLDRQRAI